jgi:hypothetical protein
MTYFNNTAKEIAGDGEDTTDSSTIDFYTQYSNSNAQLTFIPTLNSQTEKHAISVYFISGLRGRAFNLECQ